MLPTVYAVPEEKTSPRFAAAFAQGCGGEVVTTGVLRPGPWAGFGSSRTWQGLMQARRQGRDWWYGDHAYFGRGVWFRVTHNAFQHSGRGHGDKRRLERLGVEMAPWRRSGRHVLVCPPDAAFAALLGLDEQAWRSRVLTTLYANTDRPVVVRTRDQHKVRPLAADLVNCWALVTHVSNAAVEAVAAGVPVICTGDCAASIMGLCDPMQIEYPVMPPRHRWAAVLAANQWTIDEIANGDCWRAIGDV